MKKSPGVSYIVKHRENKDLKLKFYTMLPKYFNTNQTSIIKIMSIKLNSIK